MSLSKYSKRRGQFEALEAKQLFAADLVGGAAADLPDTPVVAGFDHGDLVAEFDPGDLYSVEMNPGATEGLFGGFNFLKNANLGGQEGEPLMNTNLSDHLVVDGEGLYQQNELELASSLGGQEGEPIFDNDDWDWIDNQSVQESLHACDANGQGATRHNVTGFTEVDHVFQEYAKDEFQITDQHYFAVR